MTRFEGDSIIQPPGHSAMPAIRRWRALIGFSATVRQGEVALVSMLFAKRGQHYGRMARDEVLFPEAWGRVAQEEPEGEDMKRRKKYDDTTVPPIMGSFEDAVRALLATPPPPAGHPSTRKAKSAKAKRAKKA
jgi:hypothetical protein